MPKSPETPVGFPTKMRARYEDAIWLAGIAITILMAVPTMTWGIWQYIAQPYFDRIVSEKFASVDKVVTRLSEDVKDVRRVNEEHISSLDLKTQSQIVNLHKVDSTIFDVIKYKLANEIDSSYYFEKTYFIDPEAEQSPLQQYFYATPNDRVILSIWQGGGISKISVVLNNGNPIDLTNDVIKKQHKSNWQEVEISQILATTQLSDFLMPDLPQNINLISIRPRPVSGGKGEKFEIHALLIVKRGEIK